MLGWVCERLKQQVLSFYNRRTDGDERVCKEERREKKLPEFERQMHRDRFESMEVFSLQVELKRRVG